MKFNHNIINLFILLLHVCVCIHIHIVCVYVYIYIHIHIRTRFMLSFYFSLFIYFFFFMKVLYLGIHVTRQRFKYHFNQGFCTKSKVQRICSTGDWFQNYVRRSQRIRIRKIVAQNFIVPKKLLVTMTKRINYRNLTQLYMVNKIQIIQL